MAKTGAAMASFRRTARSCAAPLASHTCQRSSKLDEAGGTVGAAVAGIDKSDARADKDSAAMQTPHREALVRAGPEWPRAQKSRNRHYTGRDNAAASRGHAALDGTAASVPF